MRSWFAQATANSSTSASNKRKSSSSASSKKVTPATPSQTTRPAAPPPAPPLQSPPMLSHPASKPQSPAASGTRAGKTAGGAAGEFKEAPPIAKPRRPLSSIQAAAGVDPGYPDGAATRTVRFQLPSSAASEPSPLLKARGPEYVTVTRVAPERERRPALPPSPLPVPVPTSLGAYGYPYTYASPADASAKRASVIANVGVAVNAAPATYPTRIGPIKLMKTLNGGTFGASYVAHDHGTGRIVCARVFKKARLSVEAKIKQGLLVEARCYKIIAASLARDRAHLMELHGILQDDERVFFVMPLMQCDLLDALGATGGLDRALVRRWVAQLALGIDALHRMGIIHRDIKPENVLLDAPRGNVRIADFNAALVVQGGSAIADGEVYSQDAVGSQPYIAWETAQRRWYGKMVDWWALGCVMFDLLTNTILFKDHGVRTTYARWDRKIEGISYLAYMGDLTDEEESVISGLIDLHPCSRYQLRHLRHHAYFVDENRVNVFDALVRTPAPDLLSMGRAAHPSLLEVEDKLRDAPLCVAAPRPPTVRTTGGGGGGGVGGGYANEDWSGFGWVNARGIWGSARCC